MTGLVTKKVVLKADLREQPMVLETVPQNPKENWMAAEMEAMTVPPTAPASLKVEKTVPTMGAAMGRPMAAL